MPYLNAANTGADSDYFSVPMGLIKKDPMARYLTFFLIISLNLTPFFVMSQHKSVCLSASGGVNKYFGLTGEYNHPLTDYTLGNACTVELSFISGKNYLPNQFACGIVIDYFGGTFREYGEGLNGVEYLNGEVSKLMVGAYLVPFIFDYNEELYVKPGIEWTYRVSTEIDGITRSNQLPNFGEEIPLTDEFAMKADFGVALTVEYVFDISKKWYVAPRYKVYCSLQDVLMEMKSFRNTLGFSIGYKLNERLYDYKRLP